VKNIILFLFSLITLLGCDFSDSKLELKNNTSMRISIMTLEEKRGQQFLLQGPKKVNPNELSKIGILNKKWNVMINESKPNTIVIYCLIMKDESLDLGYHQFIEQIKNNKCKKVVLTSVLLDQNNWQLQFPEDFR
jgi:hypothetical protein